MVIISRSLFQNAEAARLKAWAETSGTTVVGVDETSEEGPSGSVLLSRDSDHENFQTFLRNKDMSLLIPIRDEFAKDDVDQAMNILKARLKSPSPFIDFKPSPFRRDYSMISSEERWEAIEDVGEYIESQPVFSSLAEIAKTVASELLTNAFYNAPRDPMTDLALQPRRDEVSEITPPAEVKFSFGDDGTYIWLRVTDPFGTFNRQKLLEHLIRCSRDNMLKVNQGVGGAGIGLYMVYRWASQLLFEFTPGHQTTVHIKLLKTKRMKVFESQRTIFEVVELPASSGDKKAA